MKNVKYVPKSGKNAGARNFERVRDYLNSHPDCTGKEIAAALGISKVTAYAHLKKLQ